MRKNSSTPVTISQNYFVIVRIWLAKVAGVEASITEVLSALSREEDASVGHISLQLIRNAGSQVRYASHWPSRCPEPQEVVESEQYTLQQDIAAKIPDHTFILFSLDNEALWEAMHPDRLQEFFPYYTLIDGSLLRSKVRKKVSFWRTVYRQEQPTPSSTVDAGPKPVSCSGLVYDLITLNGYENNGLRHLNILFDITRNLIVTSPNIMLDLFREAERNERRFWPETTECRDKVVPHLIDKLLSRQALQSFDQLYDSVGDLLRASTADISRVFRYRELLRSRLSSPAAPP
jgi:hypothetical protein